MLFTSCPHPVSRNSHGCPSFFPQGVVPRVRPQCRLRCDARTRRRAPASTRGRGRCLLGELPRPVCRTQSAIRVGCRSGDTAVVWTLSTLGGSPCRSHRTESLTARSVSGATSPPPGVDPYDEVVWERRDARITNWNDGSVAFEQLGVEFPVTWSLNATNIVAQKYFRGTLGTPERESSLQAGRRPRRRHHHRLGHRATATSSTTTRPRPSATS